jgi:anti-sigma regulatory factor (Ser/Thr protein kinase)
VAFVINGQKEVVVKIGDVFNNIVYDGGLEEDRINIIVVDEGGHGIKLVAEHVSPALPDLADEGCGKLYVRGQMGAL